MHRSRIDEDYIFDRHEWVISIINTDREEGELLGNLIPGGHAMLVVEGEDIERGIGLDDGDLPIFVGFYDISAPPLPNQTEWTFNPAGRLYVKHKDTDDQARQEEIRSLYDRYLEHRYPHESHLVAKENAKEMIAAIRAEAAQWNRQIDEETGLGGQPFQRWGNRGVLVDPNGGYNCMGWCRKQLKIAIPDYEPSGTKDKPPKWCVIL